MVWVGSLNDQIMTARDRYLVRETRPRRPSQLGFEHSDIPVNGTNRQASIRIAMLVCRPWLPRGRLARDQLVLAGHPVVVLLRANAGQTE